MSIWLGRTLLSAIGLVPVSVVTLVAAAIGVPSPVAGPSNGPPALTRPPHFARLRLCASVVPPIRPRDSKLAALHPRVRPLLHRRGQRDSPSRCNRRRLHPPRRQQPGDAARTAAIRPHGRPHTGTVGERRRAPT